MLEQLDSPRYFSSDEETEEEPVTDTEDRSDPSTQKTWHRICTKEAVKKKEQERPAAKSKKVSC